MVNQEGDKLINNLELQVKEFKYLGSLVNTDNGEKSR